MKATTTNTLAILRGEQRSARYKYQHTLAGAARDLGIPVGWVWFWYHDKRLRSQSWLRRIWVRLQDVQKLFDNLKAVYDAFYATGEPLTTTKAICQVLGRWRDFPEQMYVSAPPKKPATSVVPLRSKSAGLVSDPVFGEEKESKESA